MIVHFTSADPRFCKSIEKDRPVTTDAKSVTCPDCQFRAMFKPNVLPFVDALVREEKRRGVSRKESAAPSVL